MYSEFTTIIKRLTQGRLWSFPGGVHPDDRKTLSNTHNIATLPLPNKLYVPVKQHIGVEGHLTVKVGDEVLKGQKLTKSMNPFAVPVHAPTSGIVTAIEQHVSAHPSGLPEQTVVIEPDKQETWAKLTPLKDYTDIPKVKLIEAICNAGISGMGGAGFPTHIKASPKKDVEFLIINGVECEPYITSDDRLMREHASQIIQGVEILVHLLQPKHIIIAIEDNKPEAIEAMTAASKDMKDCLVCSVPTRYPAGGEKQLIQMLTNREVPHHGLPIDVGVIMQNVGTCYAVADAIFAGIPLIQRVVTLTGEALDRPGNAWVPIGTPISHLLAQSEYHPKRQQKQRIIMGGPMMGFTVTSIEVPVIKTTNCILAPTESEMPPLGQEQACIRCGACADACPASLLPQQLYWHSKAKEYDKAQEYNLFDCIECGACAFECPSEIPLVHYYRQAKADIRIQEDEADKADKARERFEARKARLLREQQEREEKHRKAAEARRQAMNKPDSGAKDKIAAALARAKAKKAQATDDSAATADQPVSSEATVSKNDKVAAAIARAKAKKAAANAAPDTATSPSDQSAGDTSDSVTKQDRVALAVARAKAKKAQKQSGDTEHATQVPDQSPKNTDAQQSDKNEPAKASASTSAPGDKVALAIARAKAKKEARQREMSAQASSEKALSEQAEHAQPDKIESDTNESAQNDKQKRIAAAVAKAKAKKKAKEADATSSSKLPTSASDTGEISSASDSQSDNDTTSAEGVSQTRQQRIAAAVAKAKAKKAARETKNDNEQDT